MKRFFNIKSATLLSMLMCVGVTSARECKEITYTPTTTEGELVIERDGVIPISFEINIPARNIGIDNARIYRPYLVNGDWKRELPTIIVEGMNYKSAKADEVSFGDRKSGRATAQVYGSSYRMPLWEEVVTGVSLPYECVIDAETEAIGALLIVESERVSIRRYDSNWICRKEVDARPTIDTLNLTNPYQTVKSTFKTTFGGNEFMNLNPRMYLYTSSRSDLVQTNFSDKSVFVESECEVDQKEFSAPFEKLVDTIAKLQKEGATLDKVIIKVASSPDGPLSKNRRLAECRTMLIQKLVNESIPAFTDKITTYITVDENWDAFITVIKSRSDLSSSQILSIIKSQEDLDAREKELLKSEFGDEILRIFGELRECNVTAHYTYPIEMSDKKSCCDMYIVAVKSLKEVPFNIIAEDIEAGVTLESANNAMVAATMNGDYKAAFKHFKSIESMKMNEYIASNVAVLLSYIGDYPMSEYYFAKAKSLKSTMPNLATMHIIRGDYAKAMEIYGDCRCQNSIALKLAHGQYDKVIELTKDSGYSNAELLYLRALAYSHTENNELTLFTLEQACLADSKNRVRAKSQPEFADLYGCPAFKAIVK